MAKRKVNKTTEMSAESKTSEQLATEHGRLLDLSQKHHPIPSKHGMEEESIDFRQTKQFKRFTQFTPKFPFLGVGAS